jgi:uncharacterized membrane protein YgdD (TMEM256/DUF423 family)
MKQRETIICAAIMGGLAVVIGAFGAHALRDMLNASHRLEVYQTAVQYHFYHTLALLAAGILMRQFNSKKLSYAAIFFLTGIIFFSGSLYVLCLTGITMLGAVTPIGGVLFILGWLFLGLGIRNKS